jgi:hypothetical protein
MTNPILTILPTDLTVQSPVRIVALCGKAGAGKDTACDFIQDSFKHVYSQAFAYPLKLAAASLLGIDEFCFHSRERKSKPLETWGGITPAYFAQVLGTDAIRQTLHPDFFIKHMTNVLNAKEEDGDDYVYEKHDTIVIPDLRFQNEYDWVIGNRGIVIVIDRPGIHQIEGRDPNHPSEQISSINLHTQERTYRIVNNSTLPEFKRQVTKLFIDALVPV